MVLSTLLKKLLKYTCWGLIAWLTVGALEWAGIIQYPTTAPAVIVEAPREPLSLMIEEVMVACNGKAQGADRLVLKEQINRIAQKNLPSREAQEAFLLLICIESAFDSKAKSKSGAIGLTQIMPKLANSFAEECGLKGPVTNLADSELNLLLGSCHFQQLLNQFRGNVALALSAYNSGASSKTTANLAALKTSGIHPETAAYIVRYTLIKEKLKERGTH